MTTNPKAFTNSSTLAAWLPDRGPRRNAVTRPCFEKIRKVFERYGFEPVETPGDRVYRRARKFLPIRIALTKACFRSRMMMNNGSRCRYDLNRHWRAMWPKISTGYQNPSVISLWYVYRTKSPAQVVSVSYAI